MSSLGKAYIGALAVLSIAGCEQRSERERSESTARKDQPSVERRAEGPSERRAAEPVEPRVMPARPQAEMAAPTWESVTSSWAQKSRSAAQEIVKKYGPPDEHTASKLIWHKRGAWKRTTVSREEVPHAWPAPHTDMVEQYIDYRVPPDLFDDLAKFDGSVIAERTKGEVSARCGGEPANFLALNLVNDIVTGKRSSRDARAYYANAMKQKEQGQTDPYLERLVFEVPAGGTADPDKPQDAKPGAQPEQGEKRAPMKTPSSAPAPADTTDRP
jgi:hypothetical protein